MHTIASQKKRRAVRRAVHMPCIAVATDTYRLIGQEMLDLSPLGMLVACHPGVRLGDGVFVTFLPPGKGTWMNAEAEITRLVPGLRTGDPGPCAGLTFKNISESKRSELAARLAGIPPTIPRRPLRFRNRSTPRVAGPVFPLVKRRHAPDGVWTDYYTQLQPAIAEPPAGARGVFS